METEQEKSHKIIRPSDFALFLPFINCFGIHRRKSTVYGDG